MREVLVELTGRQDLRKMGSSPGCYSAKNQPISEVLTSRVESRLPRQLFPQFAFRLIDLRGHLDLGDHNEIALPPRALGKATAADAQLLPGVGAGRDFNVNR